MPTTAAVGAKLSAAIWNADVETGLGAWTAWTPSWSATGTAVAIGNGTFSGRYMQIGKTVTAQFYIFSGTTTTYGTGNYQFSFPVTAHSSYIAEVAMGVAAFKRATRYSGTLIYAGALTALVNYGAGASAGTLSQTAPGTWAAADLICSGTFVYEAA